jgi:hypothetical protein
MVAAAAGQIGSDGTSSTVPDPEKANEVQLDFSFPVLTLAQRAVTAFRAASRRCSDVIFFSRAFPPFRPNSTAWGFFSLFFAMCGFQRYTGDAAKSRKHLTF